MLREKLACLRVEGHHPSAPLRLRLRDARLVHDLDYRLHDMQFAQTNVDITPAQPEKLAPTESRRGEMEGDIVTIVLG